MIMLAGNGIRIITVEAGHKSVNPGRLRRDYPRRSLPAPTTGENEMKRLLATLVCLALASPLSAQWISLPTPGIPRTADGAPDLSAPTPRTAEGRPDFTGLWRTGRSTGDLSDRSKFQPWVNTLVEERSSRYFADSPRFHCLPSGPAAINSGGNSYGLRRILQHPTMIAVLYNDGTYREIFMDGRELEEDPLRTWMGYSVGRWEGDTLVVESNGYNDKTWLNSGGVSHTDQLRMTERFRRPSFGHIEIEVTYEDPGAFNSPLNAAIQMNYAADDMMLETVCTEAYLGGDREHWSTGVTGRVTTSVEVAPEILARYVGTYTGTYLTNDVTIRITMEDGQLFLQRGNGRRAPLAAQSETSFLPDGGGLGYVFTAEGDGMASAISEVRVSGAWTYERAPE